MAQLNIYFSKEEDKILEELTKKFNLSKYETVKKIVRDFIPNIIVNDIVTREDE